MEKKVGGLSFYITTGIHSGTTTASLASKNRASGGRISGGGAQAGLGALYRFDSSSEGSGHYVFAAAIGGAFAFSNAAQSYNFTALQAELGYFHRNQHLGGLGIGAKLAQGFGTKETPMHGRSALLHLNWTRFTDTQKLDFGVFFDGGMNLTNQSLTARIGVLLGLNGRPWR